MNALAATLIVEKPDWADGAYAPFIVFDDGSTDYASCSYECEVCGECAGCVSKLVTDYEKGSIDWDAEGALCKGGKQHKWGLGIYETDLIAGMFE